MLREGADRQTRQGVATTRRTRGGKRGKVASGEEDAVKRERRDVLQGDTPRETRADCDRGGGSTEGVEVAAIMTENCALPSSAGAAPTLNSIQLRYSSIIRLIKKYRRVAQSVSARVVVRGPPRVD